MSICDFNSSTFLIAEATQVGDRLRETEIGNLSMELSIEKNVTRGEITVNDTSG